MSKDFKRCPRCNFKTPSNMARCGSCGLNFEKFNNASNAEAKSAFRMGEKDRVLYTTKRPSDVSKIKLLLKCIFGGLFGWHYFSVGRKTKGWFQVIGVILGYVYTFFYVTKGIRSGYLGYLLILLGFVWLTALITWIADCIGIIFNRFKYPVSLPYSHKVEKLNNVTINTTENKGE